MQPESDKDPDKILLVQKEAIHPYRWMAVAVAFIIIGVGFVLTVRQLRHTDNEIQQSRKASCIQTYGAFSDIFLPFFPVEGKRTPKQEHDLKTLQATVKRLQVRCGAQTHVRN